MGRHRTKQPHRTRSDSSTLASPPAEAAVVVGDIYRPDTVATAMAPGFDAVVVTVGADPLKPSTVVTDSARVIVESAKKVGIRRYRGITGTSEMPAKSLLGRFSTALLRLTPVGNAARDHDGAYQAVSKSGLEWTLAACPYIKEGPSVGRYRHASVFPGGFRTIHPGDVAHFLVKELSERRYPNQAIGIWY